MDMVLLFQAFIVGVLCYLGAVETVWAYGVVGGYYILGRPLVLDWFSVWRCTGRGFVWISGTGCIYC